MSIPIAVTNRRRPRRSTTRGLRRGGLRGRAGRLAAWLRGRETAWIATGTLQNFTSAVDNITTIAGHGHVTGAGPFIVGSAGALPGGLFTGPQYWLNVIDANTFTFHLSRNDAFLDANEVDITDTGSGTNSMQPDASAIAAFTLLKQGVSPGRIQSTTDIDTLIS